MSPRQITRRRTSLSPETWHVFSCGVQVGSIGQRSGVPLHVDQWSWSCGFYPGMDMKDCRAGTASDFDRSRVAFEMAWRAIEPDLNDAQFEAWRFKQAVTSWKYRMHDKGFAMPTACRDLRSRCFCGIALHADDVTPHVAAVHLNDSRYC